MKSKVGWTTRIALRQRKDTRLWERIGERRRTCLEWLLPASLAANCHQAAGSGGMWWSATRDLDMSGHQTTGDSTRSSRQRVAQPAGPRPSKKRHFQSVTSSHLASCHTFHILAAGFRRHCDRDYHHLRRPTQRIRTCARVKSRIRGDENRGGTNPTICAEASRFLTSVLAALTTIPDKTGLFERAARPRRNTSTAVNPRDSTELISSHGRSVL